MYGRYSLSRWDRAGAWAARYELPWFEELDERPRFNIAPSQMVAVVAGGEGGAGARMMRWGLTPSWSRDGKSGPINARADTAAGKPMFRSALKKRRCLLPADGFYEWQAAAGRKVKQPWYVTVGEGEVFGFAGLWERWEGGDEAVESCCILTTEPNEVTRPIHDRMPVIAEPGRYRDWLGGCDPSDILGPYPAKMMRARKVSTWVNSPTHDDERCIGPLET